MTICRNCGTVYDEYYNVCPKCGTVFTPDTEELEQAVPERELPQPETEYSKASDSSAAVSSVQDFSDSEEDDTLPNPSSPFPYQADVPPADDSSEEDQSLPPQAEAPSEEAAPEITVIYSSSKAAGIPVQQNKKEFKDVYSSSKDSEPPVTMPNSQYGDDYTVGSPTSSAPPETSVNDFANTQDIPISPVIQKTTHREPVPSEAPASGIASRNEKQQKKKGSKGKVIAVILICCTVLAALGIGAYFLFFNKSSQEQNETPASAGEKYLNEKNWDDAIAAFKKAIESTPDDAGLYLSLAEAYEHKGEYGNAIYYLEEGYNKTNDKKIKAKLDELKSAHPSSTPEELIGTWKYYYDIDMVPEEYRTAVQSLDLNSVMALLPEGRLRTYIKIGDNYSPVGSGTWNINGNTFVASLFGSEQIFTYRDGKLYDKLTNGGVFLEKVSNKVPDESDAVIPYTEVSEPEEESSEPEEENSESEEESSEPAEESSKTEEESSDSEEESSKPEEESSVSEEESSKPEEESSETEEESSDPDDESSITVEESSEPESYAESTPSESPL